MKNTSTKVDPHPNLSNIQSNVTSDMLGITSCFSKTDLDYQKCMDTFIEDYFVTTGKTTKQVLADLDKSRSDSLIESSCHPVSHTIGRITFKRTQNIGDAFEACDQTCSSGCYHGVMERMFFSDEELSSSFKHLSYSSFETKIPGICDKDKFSNPNPAIIFNCLHGVGHAVMYSLDYNLDESLRVCGIFNTEYARSSCYGGVIMENVTGFDKKKRDLKADDPLYPCDRLEEKFLRDCYTMQTSVMTEQGLSNEQIIQECRKAGDFAPNCFVSMGRDLSNHVREGYGEYTAKECEAAGEDWSSCMQGAIYALIDFSWDLGKSSILCNAFSLQSHVEECYRSQVAYFGSAYAKTNEEIDDNCRSFAERNQDYCLSIDREI
ncbi:MAG: hypothetical protein ABIM99_02440 [Candidatus Dojkabacteria bacterium]